MLPFPFTGMSPCGTSIERVTGVMGARVAFASKRTHMGAGMQRAVAQVRQLWQPCGTIFNGRSWRTARNTSDKRKLRKRAGPRNPALTGRHFIGPSVAHALRFFTTATPSRHIQMCKGYGRTSLSSRSASVIMKLCLLGTLDTKRSQPPRSERGVRHAQLWPGTVSSSSWRSRKRQTARASTRTRLSRR